MQEKCTHTVKKIGKEIIRAKIAEHCTSHVCTHFIWRVRELQAGFQLAHIINFYFYLFVCLFYMRWMHRFLHSFDFFIRCVQQHTDNRLHRTALHCGLLQSKRTFLKEKWKKSDKYAQTHIHTHTNNTIMIEHLRINQFNKSLVLCFTYDLFRLQLRRFIILMNQRFSLNRHHYKHIN